MQDIIKSLETTNQQCIDLSRPNLVLSGPGESVMRRLAKIEALLTIAYSHLHINDDSRLTVPLTEIEARPHIRENYIDRRDYLGTLISQAKSSINAGIMAGQVVDQHGPRYMSSEKDVLRTIEGSGWAAQELIEIALHIIEVAEQETQKVAA